MHWVEELEKMRKELFLQLELPMERLTVYDEPSYKNKVQKNNQNNDQERAKNRSVVIIEIGAEE